MGVTADQQIFTPKEVAELLKVSLRTVQYELATGRLKGGRVGRQWRVTRGQLARYLEGEAS